MFVRDDYGLNEDHNGDAHQNAERDGGDEKPPGSRSWCFLDTDADYRRAARRAADDLRGTVDGARHFDHAADVRQDLAFAILEFLHQADDHDRLFDEGAFADKTARHAKLVFCFGVDDLEIGPVGAAENPLIVFDVDDGWIERKRTAAEALERRGNGRPWHLHLLYSGNFVKPCLLLLSMIPAIAQQAVHVDYACPAEDIESFGLTCSEDRPCPVFFELSAVDSIGKSVFVAGDIHTATTTLYGVLLSTDDGGASWSEAIPRIRSSTFEQFQVIGDRGWLSGQKLEPLPKDPFLMITTDGGKSWRQKTLFEETRFGSIAQFWFESALAGELIFDDSVGKTVKQELYGTMTGGESWEIRQTSTKALQLKAAKANKDWSVTAPPGSKSYLIERNAGGHKETLARFLIHIGDCK